VNTTNSQTETSTNTGTIYFLVAVATLVAMGFAAWRLAPPPTARVTEYPMLEKDDIPAAIAAGKDGSIWFTIDFSNAIGVFRNGKIERINKGTRNMDPIGIAVDQDSNAWYVDAPALSIGRVSPNNEIKTFSLGTPVARLQRLTVAPDGAVWFAEGSAYSVTRLKDNVLERFQLQSARGTPYGVAIAPDGKAWATLQQAGQIVRINPSDGKTDWFWVPTPASAPTDITVDANGDVWFLEFRGNKLGRIHNEEFTEYPIPSASRTAGVVGLTASPDGAIWFAMVRDHGLGRFKNGEFKFFNLPRLDARPIGVAADPVGNIWYVDLTGFLGTISHADATR
jgi:virginiamycin B lyase